MYIQQNKKDLLRFVCTFLGISFSNFKPTTSKKKQANKKTEVVTNVASGNEITQTHPSATSMCKRKRKIESNILINVSQRQSSAYDCFLLFRLRSNGTQLDSPFAAKSFRLFLLSCFDCGVVSKPAAAVSNWLASRMNDWFLSPAAILIKSQGQAFILLFTAHAAASWKSFRRSHLCFFLSFFLFLFFLANLSA